MMIHRMGQSISRLPLALVPIFSWACRNGGMSQDIAPTAPILTGVSPARGPTSGSTQITLIGDHFVLGSTVSFGGVLNANLLGVTDTGQEMFVTLPPDPGAQGKVPVTVRLPSWWRRRIPSVSRSTGLTRQGRAGRSAPPRGRSAPVSRRSGDGSDARDGSGPRTPSAPPLRRSMRRTR